MVKHSVYGNVSRSCGAADLAEMATSIPGLCNAHWHLRNPSGSHGTAGITSAFGNSDTGSVFGSFGSAQPVQTTATFGSTQPPNTTQPQPQPRIENERLPDVASSASACKSMRREGHKGWRKTR